MPDPVLVLVPTRDRPAMLAEALASLVAQSERDWVAVVADDGERAAVAAGAGGLPRDPRIHVAKASARTPGGARDAAWRHGERQVPGGRASLVAFLDDDDLWRPDHLARSVEALARAPDAAFVHGAAVTRGTSGEAPYHARDAGPFGGDLFATLLRRNVVATSTVVARGDLLHAAGGFRTDLPNSSDWALWLELSRRGPVAFDAEPSVVYRAHEGNVSRRLAAKNECQAAVLASWWPRRAALSRGERSVLRREVARRRRRHVRRLLDEGTVPRGEALRLAWANWTSIPHPTALRSVAEAAFLRRGRRREGQEAEGE